MTAILDISVAKSNMAAGSNILSPSLQIRKLVYPVTLLTQFNFTYGSGGTTIVAYLQTSLDFGLTWVDVVCFSVATTSLKNIYNLSSSTLITTALVPTDGSLAANSCKDGVIGPLWRVKYTITGNYAGASALRIDMKGLASA